MRCCTCGVDKPIEAFNWRNKETSRRHTSCTICTREYKKSWYNAHRQGHIAGVAAARKVRGEKNKQLLLEFLEENPCSVCGEPDVVVLQFHHRDPVKKEYAISKMMQSWSWAAILKEIAKCDVVCANCHKRIHNIWR